MDIIQELKSQVEKYIETLIIYFPKIVMATLVVAIFGVIAKFIRQQFIKFLKKRANDQLIVDFLNNIFKFINYIIAFLLFLYVIGHTGVAASIAGTAGVSAIVLGFAFRDIGENFIAGVLMAFDRPFRVGDIIQTGNVEGTIVGLSLRQTHIKTADGKDVFVPNGQLLKNPLFNHTIDGYMRYSFIIGVDYSTNIPKAIEVLEATIRTVDGILKDEKPPQIKVSNLNTSTIDIEIRYWIDTFDPKCSAIDIKSRAINACVDALEDEEILLPSTVIELKNYDTNFNIRNKIKKANDSQ